jgi:hypothetical protein
VKFTPHADDTDDRSQDVKKPHRNENRLNPSADVSPRRPSLP